MVGVADGKRMLKPDVPHAEKTAGEKGYHHHDHRALRVVAIMDMHAGAGGLVGGEKECVEPVEHGVKFLKLAPFLELWFHTVDFFL